MSRYVLYSSLTAPPASIASVVQAQAAVQSAGMALVGSGGATLIVDGEPAQIEQALQQLPGWAYTAENHEIRTPTPPRHKPR
ncbi:hypothetical protein [Caldimonas brevitalea]|uniref:YCII-related domain-containing protein n=1 Tax=Caldimonas brevitalea TaxID=413882 RepID=A0A0G3BQB8_9BURK|nr:hypothetical protein [Caldimonas brevitalea]AKJ29551.1 hypothetical protein AAW51_2860 [Caldimonas brevitalea]